MTTPDEMPVTGFTATQAHELVAAGRGVLVDTRDARLFDNAHAAGALSLPLATLEAAQGRPRARGRATRDRQGAQGRRGDEPPERAHRADIVIVLPPPERGFPCSTSSQ